MYGRRCLIGKQSEFYQKTSLKKVKQADITKLMMYICKEASIDPSKIQTCHIYGELMCNSIYDYKQRGLVGGWRVFGAIVEPRKENYAEAYEKLNKAGFSINKAVNNSRIPRLTHIRPIDIDLGSASRPGHCSCHNSDCLTSTPHVPGSVPLTHYHSFHTILSTATDKCREDL